MFIKDEVKHQELKAKGQELEHLLQSTEHSEQDKQQKLMEYLNLLNAERASDLGVIFTERMLERVAAAFEAHPTADLAVDQLYTCLLLQQFHSMQFDPWRSHPAIENCRSALTMLEAEGRWSDCLRYCQDTANTYAEAHFWPEALDYAQRTNKMGVLSASDVSRQITAPTVIAQASQDGRLERTLAATATAVAAYSSTMESLNQRLNEPFVTVNTVTGDKGIMKAQEEYDQLMKNKTPKSRRQ